MAVSVTMSLPLGHELTRLSRRDAALWSSASVVVLATFLAGTYALMLWRPAEDMPGSPPPVIAVTFAPRLMAPQEKQDLAPGPRTMQQPQAAASRAVTGEAKPKTVLKPVEIKPTEQPSKTAEPTLSQAVPKLTEIKPVAEAVETDVSHAESKVAMKEAVPDLLPAVNAEVTLPEATASSPPPTLHAVAASAAAQLPSAPSPVTRSLPDIPVEKAPVAAAPKIVYARKAKEISPAKWHMRVVAYLERFKTYPAKAMQHGERGMVLVHFSIDREGRVVSSDIARSSGSPLLDQAVLTMVRRASPVPPPPPGLPDSQLQLTAPVRFMLH